MKEVLTLRKATKNKKIKYINIIIRFMKLMIGLFICSCGFVLFNNSNMGMNAWNVFHEGLSLNLPITIGQASQIVGLVIIIISMFLKIFPGFGTILNMYFIGIFMDKIIELNIVPFPESLLFRTLMCIMGVIVLSFGMFVYMNQELGAGPRDGLMLWLTKETKYKLSTIKNTMEIIALILGIILGGKFGLGTILASLVAGPLVQRIFMLFKRNPKELNQTNIISFINEVKGL